MQTTNQRCFRTTRRCLHSPRGSNQGAPNASTYPFVRSAVTTQMARTDDAGSTRDCVDSDGRRSIAPVNEVGAPGRPHAFMGRVTRMVRPRVTRWDHNRSPGPWNRVRSCSHGGWVAAACERRQAALGAFDCSSRERAAKVGRVSSVVEQRFCNSLVDVLLRPRSSRSALKTRSKQHALS